MTPIHLPFDAAQGILLSALLCALALANWVSRASAKPRPVLRHRLRPIAANITAVWALAALLLEAARAVVLSTSGFARHVMVRHSIQPAGPYIWQPLLRLPLSPLSCLPARPPLQPSHGRRRLTVPVPRVPIDGSLPPSPCWALRPLRSCVTAQVSASASRRARTADNTRRPGRGGQGRSRRRRCGSAERSDT